MQKRLAMTFGAKPFDFDLEYRIVGDRTGRRAALLKLMILTRSRPMKAYFC
jgi:hypothetical protein